MSLMLINPKHRPKKRRSAAQRAATARMLAARHGSNPSRRKRHARRHTARRHNPIGLSRVHHRRHTRRRRNPTGTLGGMGSIGSLVMNGLKGAVGGIAINAVTNFLPAPVKTGNVLYVTRLALAILIGTAGRPVLGQHARPMAEGAMAINFADLINSFAGGMLPGSQLHGITPYYMGEFLSERLPSTAPSLPHSEREFGVMSEYVSSDYA